MKKPELNEIWWNKANKEFCMISNMKCIHDHSSQEGFQKNHPAECEYEAHEAIVLRVLNVPGFVRMAVGFTYVGVDIKDLDHLETSDFTKELFTKILCGKKTKFNVGRF